MCVGRWLEYGYGCWATEGTYVSHCQHGSIEEEYYTADEEEAA